MQFSEKLDFLMNITKTSNSALGQRVKLDASHISRLRRGQRSALKDEFTITAMAEYFAQHCTTDYQRKALADIMNISTAFFESGGISACIAKWLSNGKKDETKAVEDFLDGFMKLKAKQKAAPEIINQNDASAPIVFPSDEISVYYGVEGKRQAAVYFLSEILTQSQPQTLLLFSDEPTDWMAADRGFAMKWAQLMTGVLAKGHKIKIIHTVSRDLDEMLTAINQWMPLYMSGAIEPYYYPKKRDGVFKRTLFIAPGVSAVISNSVGNSINQAANTLFRNPDAIEAFTEEFQQYLKQCRPLTRVFTAKDAARYFETLMEFEKEKSNALIKTESLSLLTMPEKVSASILSRIGSRNLSSTRNLGDLSKINDLSSISISEYQIQRIKNFENNVQTNSFSEIVALYDLDSVRNHRVKVSFSDMMNGGSVYYTTAEYIEHLKHLVHLLKTYDNFHIKLVEGMPESNYMVYAKEDLGAIIAKTSAPPVILAVNEINLTAGFWDFLRNMIGEKDCQSPNNKEDAERLERYIERIRAL